jgi:hypothetical protein
MYKEEKLPIIGILFQETEAVKIFTNSFYETSITLMQISDKENSRPISLMKIDIKILVISK